MFISLPLVLWTVLATPVIYFIYHAVLFMKDVKRRGRAVDQFPGEPKHWLWGHLHLFPGPNEAGLAFHRARVRKYPRLNGAWLGPIWNVLCVKHPETSKELFKSSEPKPVTFGAYKFGIPWIGDGLLLSKGHKWARNRRLLTPAFHFEILKPYMAINNDCATLLVDKIRPAADKGQSFEFYSSVSLYTFDVILRCAMSFVSDVQTKGESHPYVQAVNTLSDLWVRRVLTPWLHFDFIYWLSSDGRKFTKNCEYVHSVSEKVIKDRQRVLSERQAEVKTGKSYLDFLDILLTAKDTDGKGLTFQEIRDEVDTFMFEGHDTTASGISWTLYSLAEYPEFQEKCQQEVDAILAGRDSDEITWADLNELKYTTQCVKEALRLHCPVPFIQRQLTKDMTIDGKVLPEGSMVDIQIYNLHHNPLVWKDSMTFDPSRFSPENMEKMDSFAFVPFSAGPRNCIGQNFAMHEMKTVIARVMRRYTIRLDPEFKVEKKVGVVMRTKDGMKLKVTPRDTC